MQPAGNPIEEVKASLGNPLRIRDRLPDLIGAGWEKLTPADKDLLKWLGVFFRRPTPGKFMMRIRMPNGIAASAQLRAVAALSRELGNGIVDVTTRQQLELRGFELGAVPGIFDRLRRVDLRSLQTGMDNVRNLNGCPLAGLTPHELLDASPVVLEMDRRIVGPDGNPEYANLPRKFNVVVTGCRGNCTHAESQDVALVPAVRDGRAGFNVLVGGKMGSGGFTIAKPLDAFVGIDRAADVACGLALLFRDHGPRGPRSKVRFAFLVAAWGTERIRAELEARLGISLERAGEDARDPDTHRDHLGIEPQRQPGRVSVGLCVPTGRLSAGQLDELARLAEEYGTGDVRLAVSQDAILPNVPEARLPALLREPLLRDLSPAPSRFLRRMVACTGTDFCNLALIETKGHALDLSRRLAERLGPEGPPVTIHWSGCPAACGNHQAADIGLRGLKANVDGKVIDAVAVYVGGRTGPRSRPGTLLMDPVPCDDALPDVIAAVARHLDLFRRVERDEGAPERVLMIPALDASEVARAGAETAA